MKSIFDTTAKQELVTRINSLTNNHKAQWGKMNAFQMVKHCIIADEMMQGKIKLKRVFIGRLIGKMVLKKSLEEGRPFGKNSPTAPILETLNASGDIETEKQKWLHSIHQYANFNNHDFVHPFFGRMTKDQIGPFVYKHIDHHLSQFGV